MNESERYQAYLAAMNEASHLYGFQISTQVQPEVLGAVVQVRAVVTITAIPNWQPAASSSLDGETELAERTEQDI